MNEQSKSSAAGSFAKLMEAPPAENPQPRQEQPTSRNAQKSRTTTKVSRPPARPSSGQTKQPVGQSSGQSTNRSTDQSTEQQLSGEVVNRPVSFYIPVSINRKIDEAVDYLEKRQRVKVDRSAVVSAILGDPDFWKPKSLNRLADKCVDQLTNRLTSRLIGRPVD